METDLVSEALFSSLFGIPDDGQSPQILWFWGLKALRKRHMARVCEHDYDPSG
jgi:hypothetical protein